jgi:transcriptional regulator with XRE-family HTH domain
MAPDQPPFGDLVRHHRHLRLLTQEELSAKSGLSVRTIQDIEAGRVRRPRRVTVGMLADAFALTPPDRVMFARSAAGTSVATPSVATTSFTTTSFATPASAPRAAVTRMVESGAPDRVLLASALDHLRASLTLLTRLAERR